MSEGYKRMKSHPGAIDVTTECRNLKTEFILRFQGYINILIVIYNILNTRIYAKRHIPTKADSPEWIHHHNGESAFYY